MKSGRIEDGYDKTGRDKPVKKREGCSDPAHYYVEPEVQEIPIMWAILLT